MAAAVSRAALDCLIVGAGPAGLAAARRLHASGLSCQVLEAEAVGGGRTRSVVHGGHTLDTGAAFLTSFYPRTLALARGAGVALAAPGFHPGRAGYPHALLIDGRLRPHDIGSLRGYLRFPYVPGAQKWRAALAVARGAAARWHVAEPASLAPIDTESAGQWAERELGGAAFEYLVRCAFEPFFFYEAAGASAAVVRALLGHSLRWRLYAPPGGMGLLCAALARRVPVTYGTRVTAIDGEAGQLVARHERGAVAARAAIVAIPPAALLQVRMPLAAPDWAAIRAVEFAPSLRLNLHYGRTAVLDPPAVTPCGPGPRAIVGVSAMSRWLPQRTPPGREIVRVSASASRSAQLAGLSVEAAGRALLADCRGLGLELPDPDEVTAFEEPHAIVRTPAGHFTGALRFINGVRGTLDFAGDWLTGSTIEGAVRTGEAAAGRVIARLRDG
jgi:protoporphyrinogen/coproporphyrinogen III oxidase